MSAQHVCAHCGLPAATATGNHDMMTDCIAALIAARQAAEQKLNKRLEQEHEPDDDEIRLALLWAQ